MITRLRHRLPGLLVAVGATAIVLTVPLVLTMGTPAKELPWVAGMAIFVGAAAYVRHRRPDDPLARWFALTAGIVAVVQLLDGVILQLGREGTREALAWALLPSQLLTIAAVAAMARLLGLFPDGRVQHPYEQRILGALWWLLVLPPIAFATGPHLVAPSYHQLPEVANPYAVAVLAPVGSLAAGAIALAQGAFVLGVVLLVLRYRRAASAPRRQMRWLLLPALLAASVAVLDLVAWRLVPVEAPSGGVEVLLSVLWIAVLASLPLSIAVAILRPDALDVDWVLRKSLVYGVLWAIIAAVYVGAAAGLGLAAGRRLPLGTAIGIAVAATLVFQPTRQRLERVADRWVFGARADPSRLVTQLGAALEHTVELEHLLPRMADTLQEGLGLRWARVRLEPARSAGDDDERPILSVPIVLEEEELGVVECGPKAVGHLTADDAAVVATFARQAALAVRNVRLTAELEGSRARLVRAQDAERRRLERNIHDGVQQDLVALTGHAAHVRSELRRDPAAGDAALLELQEGLRRVIGEIRELAHGIHPSILSDRGLLEAVEALAARSAIPVSVRADGELRGQRFAEEIEGAGYFTVAEALANAGKHARASHVEVRLARTTSSLQIAVDDDGDGFDPGCAAGGEGLVNLAERLAALGGRLDVRSAPGRGTTVAADLRIAGA